MGVVPMTENAAVTWPCQQTWPVNEEAGGGISGVAKGVATVY